MALWHFVAYFIFTSCQVAGQSPVYAVKGQEVTFKPNITGRLDAIVWRQDGKIVVEFDGQKEQVHSPFTNRISLDRDSAELKITDIRFEDSGDYELQGHTDVLHSFHYKLMVQEDNSLLIRALVSTILSSLSLLLLGLALGIFLCKRRNKACFANRNTPDPKNQTRPGATEGECGPLVDRTPTIPSTQRLSQDPGELNEPAEEEVPHGDSSDSEKENEPKESSTASEHQDSEKNSHQP